MEQIIKNDMWHEHQQHDTYKEGCSECYKQARLIKSWSIVNVPQEIHEHNESALRGGLFGNTSPWDRNPLE